MSGVPGSEVSIGSISGMRGTTFAGHGVHGAAKSGVINLTRHLAVSGGPHNIRAVCISPGLIRTPATEALIDSPDAPLATMLDSIPRRPVRRARGDRRGGAVPRLRRSLVHQRREHRRRRRRVNYQALVNHEGKPLPVPPSPLDRRLVCAQLYSTHSTGPVPSPSPK
jgi:NAD(P)-dependent dehydrogenase (short-subunit alcohol dehydrogenase family)